MTRSTTTMSYRQRVAFARAWFEQPKHLRDYECDRQLDNCFEMYDGEYVVTQLVREARTNARLQSGIRNDGESMWQQWQQTAAKHEHLPDLDALDRAARQHRKECRARFLAWLEKQQGPASAQMELTL